MNLLLPTVTGGLEKIVTFWSSVTFHQQANPVHALLHFVWQHFSIAAAAAVIWHLVSRANRRREQVADSDPANHRKRCGTLQNLEFERLSWYTKHHLELVLLSAVSPSQSVSCLTRRLVYGTRTQTWRKYLIIRQSTYRLRPSFYLPSLFLLWLLLLLSLHNLIWK